MSDQLKRALRRLVIIDDLLIKMREGDCHWSYIKQLEKLRTDINNEIKEIENETTVLDSENHKSNQGQPIERPDWWDNHTDTDTDDYDSNRRNP